MQADHWLILEGALTTVVLSLCAFLLAIVMGFAGAAAKLSRRRALQWIANFYTFMVRGIPDLVLLLLFFYGGGFLIQQIYSSIGIESTYYANSFGLGVLALGFVYGAAMTDTFRAALAAIPRGQFDAAWAFGMGRRMTFFRITLPQMMRYALPGITNNWILLVKATALVSLMGLHDMTNLTPQVVESTGSPLHYLLVTAVLYLMYASITVYLLNFFNARYSLGSQPRRL
jgi:arginine/ornithine transport system permease protein